jgi:hypothetical protein
MDRFQTVLAQKVYFHRYLDALEFKHLHVIDTKYGHSKRLIQSHSVTQMGYDFNIKSTNYLKRARQRYQDVVWLDYCCTASKPFVLQDLRLCKTKWVFCTFSVRACRWKAQIRHIVKGTLYKPAWVYEYNDTSPMIIVAYYRRKPPPLHLNPVGKKYKYKYKNKWYVRECKKLLLGPSDEPDELYYQFKDSNEPAALCVEV